MRFNQRALQESSERYQKLVLANGALTIFTQNEPMIVATAYLNKQSSPLFNYRFKSIEQREQFISEKAATIEKNLAANAQYKIEQKARRKEETAKFLASLKPGVVLYDTWGYEQTNVEFYEVIAVKGSKVTVRELCHHEVSQTGWASNTVIPATGENRFSGQEVTVNVRGPGIRISDCVVLHSYSGGPVYKSWYA